MSNRATNLWIGVDEAPDFLDPYSDLSLFLAREIKKEMQDSGFSQKWSLKVQEQLVQKISPEFQKKFPQYRLGVFAVKKVWDKVSYYVQQLQNQKEAFTKEGKLNISFLIKENLKHIKSLQSTSENISPHYYAHQLAAKMSECIATVDGTRPTLNNLAKTIWSVQKHLMKGEVPGKNPYEKHDNIDKLIVKAILETPAHSQEELEKAITEKLSAPLKAEEEAIRVQIDHPEKKPEEALRLAREFALKARQIIKENPSETPQRIHNWTIQGDMLLRYIRLGENSPLITLITEKAKTLSTTEEIAQTYLTLYPHLTAYKKELEQRIEMFYKYVWYAHLSVPEESTFDRFVKWHKFQNPTLTTDELSAICKRHLPLLPFE